MCLCDFYNFYSQCSCTLHFVSSLTIIEYNSSLAKMPPVHVPCVKIMIIIYMYIYDNIIISLHDNDHVE